MPTSFWLSEEQFARLQPLLPTKVRGVPRVDDRRVISGIIRVLRNGCRWRAAPAVYGLSKTLYSRFVRWARKGVWDNVFAELAAAGGHRWRCCWIRRRSRCIGRPQGEKGGARLGHWPLAGRAHDQNPRGR